MITHPFINKHWVIGSVSATNPYYIFAPAYTENSSGVKVLHFLCHLLNESGQKAYLYPDNPQGYATHPLLDTPVIIERPGEHNYYRNNGIEAIAVYSDIVKGNPLEVKKVVRYLLAPAGEYGGDAVFADTDRVWGYTTPVTKGAGSHKVLCLPTFDSKIYYTSEQYRQGSCFYSHKYDRIHRNMLFPSMSRNSERLVGSPERVASILRKSERCYVYEMSEVIINAGLCGCPVTLVRSDYFNTIDPELEFDFSHCSWSDAPGEAIVTQGKSQETLYSDFFNQLRQFIEETQL